MIEIINKIKSAITSLEKEKQPLLICALFLRQEPLEKWDIIISASWLNPTEMGSYKIISSKLKDYLEDAELMQFSRIVLLDPKDPIVSYLQNLKTIDNGGFHELEEEELSDKFKFIIKKAYLLRSKKSE
ncbi:MAG: hypothetical protein PVI40_04600 [Chlamydiota bacterium]|jgi:hypothetical protein